MRAIVFLGPTLPVDEAARHLRADYHPPAARGDVYAAARERPDAIGIVDGYFHSVPSVWHKEILWALSRGIRVYGASSIGALRAAELHRFGMVGIGRVFDAFVSGALDRDDEVAVLHAPVELGARPLTEPLVNIRETLARGVAADAVSEGAAAELVRIAERLHYTQRTYERVFARAAESPRAELRDAADRIRRGLPQLAVDVKAEDARRMLDAIARAGGAGEDARTRPSPFVVTERWQSLCDSLG